MYIEAESAIIDDDLSHVLLESPTIHSLDVTVPTEIRAIVVTTWKVVEPAGCSRERAGTVVGLTAWVEGEPVARLLIAGDGLHAPEGRHIAYTVQTQKERLGIYMRSGPASKDETASRYKNLAGRCWRCWNRDRGTATMATYECVPCHHVVLCEECANSDRLTTNKCALCGVYTSSWERAKQTSGK